MCVPLQPIPTDPQNTSFSPFSKRQKMQDVNEQPVLALGYYAFRDKQNPIDLESILLGWTGSNRQFRRIGQIPPVWAYYHYRLIRAGLHGCQQLTYNPSKVIIFV
jgi:hypothetical protein